IFLFDSRAKVDHTSVYALCTFKNNTEIGNVDKVIIYKKFSEKTNQISLLGTYTLDTNSLYVNDYHETTPLTTQGPTVKVTPNPPLEEAFNVTFIITNLPLTPELENSGSQLHNSAAKVIANRLDNIFNNSNISPAFSHCNVESFSRAKVDHTSVYALCTFKNNPEIGNVDKVIIYKKFSEKTNQISLLGTYTLDTNSLYVNGNRANDWNILNFVLEDF
uniref:SEA domain-containing protein n=1 Tax=Callorhinchus milii TaxID=7868 RepID=A0A4W3H6C7_CALMI